MKRLLSLVVLVLGIQLQVFATHVRAGEFSYSYVGNNTFKVQIRTYTEIGGVSAQADQDRLPMDWGDGVTDTIFRLTVGGKISIAVGSNYNIQENVYEGTHTYSGFGIYKLSMQDVNRVEGINNVNGGVSDQIPLYVEDSLYFLDPAAFGPVNNSPILASHAVDFGQVGRIFHHNPAAYDPDGDSLAFEFYTPFQSQGIAVTNWIVPNNVNGTTGTFTIDPKTGIVTWDFPTYQGMVNVGIKIREYRRRINNGKTEYFVMGMMLRDLQIIIGPSNDHPPVVKARDTCIIAGTHLLLPIPVTDIDFGPVTITADGGPFEVNVSPATITQNYKAGDSAHAVLDWQTVCDHANAFPYQVLVRATDSYSLPLTTTTIINIKVVAPPPQNLTAKPQGNTILLNWLNPYSCDSTKSSRFLGFSIWRREGSNPFTPDSCTPGLDGRGYIEIASNVHAFTYTDINVDIGKDYCYRVLGEFGTTTSLGYLVQFVRSIPSNEACSQLKKSLPLITKASVNTTDIHNGSIRVEWANPTIPDLDTIQFRGPYRYELYHSPDFNFRNPRGPIVVYTSPSFKGLLPDSTYMDTLIDTKDSAYSYVVKFYADTTFVGPTKSASSVYLTLTPAGRQLTLNWSENVPWTNDKYVVYRRDNHSAGAFVEIDTTTVETYIDKGLKNDSTYCYRILSIGHYSASGLPNPILNFSEESCGVPIDTVGPCPPTLTVQNQCNGSVISKPNINYLTWSPLPTNCGGDAIKFYIYYAPDDNSPLTLLDTTRLVGQDTFTHFLDNTVAGCYAVAAVDSYYNKGPLSLKVCVDNCPEYNLPNTFTPNHDGSNELFVPRNPYRFIAKVSMKIFTSWGSLVYETTDPAIKWDGKIQSSGKDAPDGTYYYVCEVFEDRLTNANTPSKTLSGFIHLYR